MDETRRENYGKYVFILLELLSLIAGFICLYKTNMDSKMLLCILPFGFFVISFLFNKNYVYITDDISKLLIIALFFVRLVVLPFLYSANTGAQLFEGRNSVEAYFNKACILMVYEFLIVQAVLYFYDFKKEKQSTFAKNDSRIDITKALIVCLAIYVLGIAIFLPGYAENFKTIFHVGDADFAVADGKAEYNIGSIGRVLKTLFTMAVQLFRILFPAFLMKHFFDRNPESKWCTFMLILSCVLQFMFLTSTFAEAIVSCLALILYYIKLYPQRKDKSFLFLGISTLGMLILYFAVRYLSHEVVGMYSKEGGVMSYAAQIINAYFTGVDNVAAIFNIPAGHQSEAFQAGLLGAIPFNSTLFGNRGSKLQYFFNAYNNSYGQIPPTIGAGYYYFGTLLSPVITALFVMLSVRYYRKAQCMEPSLKYVAVIFCSMVFALGTVMYSPSITLSWYFSWGIPMLILTLFTNEDRENKI